MKKITDAHLLKHYFDKYNLESIFDSTIFSHGQLHFFEREELILVAETELEYYYLLVKGKIKISYLFENGKAMLLKFYTPLNSVGDVELFKNIPVRCNVEAMDDTYLIAIPATVLRREYRNNVSFLHYLLDSLSEKLDATINNGSYNYVYPLINRLATYLVEHQIAKDYIHLNTSFKDIAQFLGTTYRHLSRTFNELEAKSIIRCEGKTIIVLDEGKLQALSKNDFKGTF